MVNHEMVTHGSHPDYGPILDEILEMGKKTHHHLKHSHEDLNELIKPFYVPQMQIPASGLLDDVNNFAPERNFVWDVMRVTASGFTSGTVQMYVSNTEGDQILNFPNAGSFFFNEHNFMVLERVRRPVFQLTGTNVNPFIGLEGISIHKSLLGKYLLGG